MAVGDFEECGSTQRMTWGGRSHAWKPTPAALVCSVQAIDTTRKVVADSR